MKMFWWLKFHSEQICQRMMKNQNMFFENQNLADLNKDEEFHKKFHWLTLVMSSHSSWYL